MLRVSSFRKRRLDEVRKSVPCLKIFGMRTGHCARAGWSDDVAGSVRYAFGIRRKCRQFLVSALKQSLPFFYFRIPTTLTLSALSLFVANVLHASVFCFVIAILDCVSLCRGFRSNRRFLINLTSRPSLTDHNIMSADFDLDGVFCLLVINVYNVYVMMGYTESSTVLDSIQCRYLPRRYLENSPSCMSTLCAECLYYRFACCIYLFQIIMSHRSIPLRLLYVWYI